MPQRIDIINPFLEKDPSDYQCFGCAPHNPGGLHMHFYLEDGVFFGIWQPQNNFEGYKGVLHGGIQATMMDEVASWFVYSQIGTAGVTKSMQVAYISPTRVTELPILVKAVLQEKVENEIHLAVELISESKVTATATVVYFVFPEAIARSRYNYPGKEAFYTKIERL
ncbi:MAG TPA: PaaI family thioesterase [Marinilabiliaceae bacterium]|nr:PaaI family thioesterase [Marinilabiliaceae bacterium]